MSEKKTRLTPEELAKAHDGLCGVAIGDAPCACLVHWIKALQEEADAARDLIQRLYDLHGKEVASVDNALDHPGSCDCERCCAWSDAGVFLYPHLVIPGTERRASLSEHKCDQCGAKLEKYGDQLLCRKCNGMCG